MEWIPAAEVAISWTRGREGGRFFAHFLLAVGRFDIVIGSRFFLPIPTDRS